MTHHTDTSTAPNPVRSWLAGLSLVMLALMFVLPFLIPHHRIPITTFYNQWLAIALGVASALVLFSRSSWKPIQLPAIALVPTGLILVLLLQLFTERAIYWQHHFTVMLVLGWATLLMIIAAQLRRQIGLERIVPWLAWALLLGGLLSSAIMVMQLQGWDQSAFILRHQNGSLAGNIGQTNHIATYLALALASLMYLHLTRRISNASWLVVGLVLLAALTLTGQRMAVLYVLLLSIGGWLLARRSADAGFAVRANWALWLIPGFVLMQWLLPWLIASGATMPVDNVVDNLQRESTRLLYLQQAWQMFTGSPLLGVGWGQFGWHNFLLTGDYPAQTGYVDNAHNLPLQLLAETGLAGAVIVIGGLLWWLLAQFGVRLSAERWWLLALLAVLGSHSLLEYPLWYAYFLGPCALLLGLGEGRSHAMNFSLGGVLASATMAFAVFMLVLTVKDYSRIEGWYSDGRRGLLSEQETIDVLHEMALARETSLFAPYLDLMIARFLPNTAEALDDKLAINEQVMHFMPGEQEVFMQASLLAMHDRPEEATRQLQLAMQQYPDYLSTYWKVMTRQLLVERHKQIFPLIQQLQDYQDEIDPLED